ncbi:MAG: TRAP transporter small permease [Gemmobacter sp.]|nr:TRAP transporter small permease [Gemmobacter sp.]
MSLIPRLLGRTIDATTLMGAAAVALMTLHITADVVSKYLVGLPMPGTITVVSNYYMIVVAFLPLAFTERQNGHISVEVVVEYFPAAPRYWLNIFTLLFACVVFAMLTWQGVIEAGRSYTSGAFMIEQDVKLLIWPARYLLPLGCGLMTLTLATKVVIALVRGRRLNPDAPYF